MAGTKLAQPVWPRLKTFALVTLAGIVFGIISYQLASLKTEHIVVLVAAVVMISLSMLFLPRFADFLLVSFLCSIPLTSFTKSFFFNAWDHELKAKAAMRFSGIVSISVPDLILFALYFLWFFHIVVMRSRRVPRLHKYDILPLMLLAAYFLSIAGSPQPKAALFGLYFLLVHVLAYFYVSRNLELRHLYWVAFAVSVMVLFESALGVFQYATGKWLSLAWSRGAADGLDVQYVVPGIEHIKRATGTTFDSHSYGIYLAMLAPFPFVLAFARFTKPSGRAYWGGMFGLAMIAVVLSFSRSAWLSSAIALIFVWAVHLMWGQRDILRPTLLLGLLMLILSPVWAPLIIERVTSAGSELLTSRFDQYPVAWAIWMDNFFVGFGVGNYMDALHDYNKPGVLELPVHNVFLWVAAESGLLGVIAFFGVAFAAIARSWRVVKQNRGRTSVFALAVMGGLIAYLIDGLTDPLFREPVVYMMYWVLIAMSVAIVRINQKEVGNDEYRS